MRSTTTFCLTTACLMLTLSGCRPAPAPPTPAPSIVSHIAVSPHGYATQLVANGTELVWDLNATGYKSYVIHFQGAGPCGPPSDFFGSPGHPAHCTVKGQVNLSSYKYVIFVDYPDLPLAESNAIQPKTLADNGGGAGHKSTLRVVGCPSCPPNIITGVDTTEGAPQGDDMSPPDPALAGGKGGEGAPPPVFRGGDGIPGQIEVSCAENHAKVTTPLAAAQGTIAYWQSFGGAGNPTITFKGGSPCKADPKAPDFSCFLTGKPADYKYTLAVPPVAAPNPPASCTLPAEGVITVTSPR